MCMKQIWSNCFDVLCMKEFFVLRCYHRYRSQRRIYRWAGSVSVPPGSPQRLNLDSKESIWQSLQQTEYIQIFLDCSSKLVSIPSFITFDSWSCSNRGPISSPIIPRMMASTSTRALLSRKLKSPNQKIWSNLVVTSAEIKNLKKNFHRLTLI